MVKDHEVGPGIGRTDRAVGKSILKKPHVRSRVMRTKAPAASVGSKWKAAIVADANTGRATYILTFPTVGGALREHRVPAGKREQVRNIRRELLDYDADLPGDERDDVDLIKGLIERVDRVPLIEVDKPGFTPKGRGFVLGPRMLGEARNRYWWRGVPDTSTAGVASGTKEGWDEAGALLAHSTFASLGVLAILASPVRKYLEHRTSLSLPRAPIISETATFNFVGASAAGKTVLGAVAASVTGHHASRSIWDFSRRGLEEYLESRDQIGAIFDDTEKHIGEYLTLEKAIAIVTQYVAGGRSKEISATAERIGLNRKSWDTFALSSSVRLTDEILKRRTDGHKVRFLDLVLPKRELGGIIDNPPPGVDRVEFAKEAVREIESKIGAHFGHLFPAWMELLLTEDRSQRLIALCDLFVQKMETSGSGYDERYARKFGVLYASGQLAVENGLLPWPFDWPAKAVQRCYRNALAAANREQTLVAHALARLQQMVSVERFPRAREEKGYIRVLGQGDCGVLHRHRASTSLA
jgi:hypothetical protein